MNAHVLAIEQGECSMVNLGWEGFCYVGGEEEQLVRKHRCGGYCFF